MCGGGGPAPAPVANPEADRRKVEADATAAANAKIIEGKRRKRSASNLLSTMADGVDALGGAASVLANSGAPSTEGTVLGSVKKPPTYGTAGASAQSTGTS